MINPAALLEDAQTGIYVPGYGQLNAKLMIVGEAPGVYEAIHNPPMGFVGPTGNMIAEDLALGGMRIGECYRTNVFKYHPPNNNLKRAAETGHTIEEGLSQLWDEVNAVKRNCILAVGALAFENVDWQERNNVLAWINHNYKAW